MPLAFRRSDTQARVPIPGLPFVLGCGADDDLVLREEGVQPRHARLRVKRGALLLSAEDGCLIWVNGARVPFMALAPGDAVALSDPAAGGVVCTFEDRMPDVFLPPGAAPIDAWLRLPGAEDPQTGPDRYGPGRPLAVGSCSTRVALPWGGEGIRKVLRPLGPRDPAPAEVLRLLQRLAGAPHPALASVLDGGVALQKGRPVPWLVAARVPGRALQTEARQGGASLREVVGWLGELASGLVHLHARGVVHRDVAPGNVIRRPEGRVVLIDYGASVLTEGTVRPSAGIIGTPGFVGPEEILGEAPRPGPKLDVYGLAACGYAWLGGRAPAHGGDVLDTLARGTQRIMPLAELGCDVPQPLEAVLLDALAPDPAQRPDMRTFARRLAFAGAEAGL